MTNVLLTMIAISIGTLPGADTVQSELDIAPAIVFRDDQDSANLPQPQPPKWLTNASGSPVFRAQGPATGTYDTPPLTTPFVPSQPYQPYQPLNPFQPGPDPVIPYLNEPAPVVISGINGPQPQRFGFTPFFDGSYITPSSTKAPGIGRLAVQEYNGALRYVSMLGPDWVMSNTAEGGVRLWDGPAKPDLPGSVFRFGWDFLLHSPQWGRWSGQVDFNPSINTDLNSSLGREAWNLDAGAALFYTVSPQLMLVMGVQYWDRVDNIIIPNAGVVWNPNDRLEMRLLFPKSRISYFIGNHGPGAHWIYATGEYHTEAYQITMPATGRDQIQMTDWRVAIGLRSDHQWYDKYFEVGYVFGRKAEFLNSVPSFNIGDGLMIRFGVRF